MARIQTLHGGDDEGPPPPAPPGPPPPPSAPPSPQDERQRHIEENKAYWEQELKAESARLGGIDYSSELGDVLRQVGYDTGPQPKDALAAAIAKLRARAGNVTDRGAQTAAPDPNDPRTATTTRSLQIPPFQFNDPYTKMYEDVLKAQLESLTGQNAQMQQLMNFLNKQFETLSASPGYSPEELAVLQTQAFEPIEAQRRAAQQRILERASARGVLPSSGVIQGEQRLADTDYDRLRAAANRDVALAGINQQKEKRQEALRLAQLGVSIPDARGMQGLDVANLLYQLPRTAMMDANAILGGSSPTGALSPFISLFSQQMGQQRYNQMNSQQLMEMLGQILGQYF